MHPESVFLYLKYSFCSLPPREVTAVVSSHSHIDSCCFLFLKKKTFSSMWSHLCNAQPLCLNKWQRANSSSMLNYDVIAAVVICCFSPKTPHKRLLGPNACIHAPKYVSVAGLFLVTNVSALTWWQLSAAELETKQSVDDSF